MLEMPKLKDTELPYIFEEPVFKGEPLLFYDEEENSTRLAKDPVFSLIASLTITVRDVYRYSETLELEDAFAVAGDQRLKMLDCRTPEMREVIWQEVFAFLSFFIGQTWEGEYGISAAHIATVLLHIYSERENKWQAVIKTKNAKSIATLEKEKVLALITNPHEYGAFILSKANDV